jgi:hypothetical protein
MTILCQINNANLPEIVIELVYGIGYRILYE